MRVRFGAHPVKARPAVLRVLQPALDGLPIPRDWGVISVRPVTGLRELWAFVNLPWQLYQADPHWLPPLRLERLLHLSRHNPYFEHGQACYWLAWREGRPVGRITAQIDQLEQGAGTGHFGFLEAEDDLRVFSALLDAAEDWLRDRGIRQVTGPFNFSINQECGLLVDGFDSPPVVMMPHNPEYYRRQLEAAGYSKAKDMLAYWVNSDFEWPRVMTGLLKRFRNSINIRMLDRENLKQEVSLLREIFNDAWAGNWGFVPFTESEFNEIGTLLKLVVERDWTWIAEVEGEPAAFIIEIPNINEISRDLNGRLLPLGWLHAMRRIRKHQIQSARVPLMGVQRRYQNTPLGAALAYRLIGSLQEPTIKKGIPGVELSWILEDNKGMDTILRSIGCWDYKRYRIYGKQLGP